MQPSPSENRLPAENVFIHDLSTSVIYFILNFIYSCGRQIYFGVIGQKLHNEPKLFIPESTEMKVDVCNLAWLCFSGFRKLAKPLWAITNYFRERVFLLAVLQLQMHVHVSLAKN